MSFRPRQFNRLIVLLCAVLPSLTFLSTRVLARPQFGRMRTATPLVRLPADQAAHPHVHNEWWYVVGHLKSGRRTFGYELTIFKFTNIRPPGFSTPLSLYRTDVALTDEQGKRFYHHLTPYFPNSATVSDRSLSIHIGPTVLRGTSLHDMHLQTRVASSSFNLHLNSTRPPLYVGGRGYLPFGKGFTYYYSLTDIATTGTLRFKGSSYSVTGVSWMDHQWGNWAWNDISGWTWMCLQLDNGIQLSVFDFRGYGRHTQAANILNRQGKTIVTTNTTIRPSGTWTSPHTTGVYPASETVAVPTARAHLVVKPTISDQELVFPQDKRGSYWEGSSTVSGTYAGKRVTGVAYLELTGYVAR